MTVSEIYRKHKKLILAIVLIVLSLLVLILASNLIPKNTLEVPDKDNSEENVSYPEVPNTNKLQTLNGRVFDFTLQLESNLRVEWHNSHRVFMGEGITNPCTTEIITFFNSDIEISLKSGNNECIGTSKGEVESVTSKDGKEYDLFTSDSGILAKYDLNLADQSISRIQISANFTSDSNKALLKGDIIKIVESAELREGLNLQNLDSISAAFENLNSPIVSKFFKFSFEYDHEVLGIAQGRISKAFARDDAYGPDRIFCMYESIGFSASDLSLTFIKGGIDGCYGGFGGVAELEEPIVTKNGIESTIRSGSEIGLNAFINLEDEDVANHIGGSTLRISSRNESDLEIAKKIISTLIFEPGLRDINFDRTTK